MHFANLIIFPWTNLRKFAKLIERKRTKGFLAIDIYPKKPNLTLIINI